MNIETGQTYYFGESIPSKKSGGDKKVSIRNISYQYGTNILPQKILRYIHGIVRKKMKKVHGDDVPRLETYGVEISLDNLIRYVRCPYINSELYSDIIDGSRRYSYTDLNPILKELSVKNTCRDPIAQMLKQSKIPKVKSLRKIVYEEPRSLPMLALISRSFKNVDLIRSLYLAYNNFSRKAGDYCNIDFSARLFKTMIAYHGETVVANRLISYIKQDEHNNAYRTLAEMIVDFDKIERCDFDFSKRYSMHELHMYLAGTLAKRERENRKIEHLPAETALKKVDRQFSLMPANDTHELIDVGITMNICVATYAGLALDKKCSIFVLRDYKEHKPVGCIELVGNKVVQVKGPRNHLLQGAEVAFIESWILENGLRVATEDI